MKPVTTEKLFDFLMNKIDSHKSEIQDYEDLVDNLNDKLQHAAFALENYLKAGSKEGRHEASGHAKEIYKRIMGKDFKND